MRVRIVAQVYKSYVRMRAPKESQGAEFAFDQESRCATLTFSGNAGSLQKVGMGERTPSLPAAPTVPDIARR